VAWPGEGIFVGEPLARPWGESTVEIQADSIVISTTMLDPTRVYRVVGGPTAQGPFDMVLDGIVVPHHMRATITIGEASRAYYKLEAL
jgi:hypothetical protein